MIINLSIYCQNSKQIKFLLKKLSYHIAFKIISMYQNLNRFDAINYSFILRINWIKYNFN